MDERLGPKLGSYTTRVVQPWWVDVYERALLYRSRTSNKLILWEDVREVRYNKARVTVNLAIPTTEYGLAVRDRHGQTISVIQRAYPHSRIRRACRSCGASRKPRDPRQRQGAT
jgi:hypothetical protein